jgi:hypothetical protein
VSCPLFGLLDLGFLVQDVLAHHGIELFEFHLIGMELLVLGGGVKVPGPGAGNEFYFVTHWLLSLPYEVIA